MHQTKRSLAHVSLDCIEKLTECMESIDIEEVDCDTCFIMQEILSDKIDDPEFLEFAIENLDELLSYIINGNLNISQELSIAINNLILSAFVG